MKEIFFGVDNNCVSRIVTTLGNKEEISFLHTHVIH